MTEMSSSSALSSNLSLQPYNFLGLAATAAWGQFIHHQQELFSLLKNPPPSDEILVLGSGSNVVLLDDYPGLVLFNRLQGIQPLRETQQHVWVRVAGGMGWDDWVAYSLQQGWYGLENLSAIPGTVGAAPVQNIGAYGVELADCVATVECIQLSTGRKLRVSANDCQFGYRDSIFKTPAMNAVFINAVEFKLSKTPNLKLEYGELNKSMQQRGLNPDQLTPLQLRQIITEIRLEKLPDPKTHPNVGSFFKNPVIDKDHWQQLLQEFPALVAYPISDEKVKVAAGWLIDHLGWKGRGNNGAQVYKKQALVLINRSESSEYLVTLVRDIKADVAQRFGIELEIEPRLVGPF